MREQRSSGSRTLKVKKKLQKPESESGADRVQVKRIQRKTMPPLIRFMYHPIKLKEGFVIIKVWDFFFFFEETQHQHLKGTEFETALRLLNFRQFLRFFFL